MDDKTTILEGIMGDVAAALYQKWYNALPDEEKTGVTSKALGLNAKETTFFVVQMFMNKFNEAAEELKDN